MSFFDKISTKFAFGFLCMVLICILIGGVAYLKLNEEVTITDHIFHNNVPVFSDIQTLRKKFSATLEKCNGFIRFGESFDIETFNSDVSTIQNLISTLGQDIRQARVADSTSDLYNDLDNFKGTFRYIVQVRSSISEKRDDAAKTLEGILETADGVFTKLRAQGDTDTLILHDLYRIVTRTLEIRNLIFSMADIEQSEDVKKILDENLKQIKTLLDGLSVRLSSNAGYFALLGDVRNMSEKVNAYGENSVKIVNDLKNLTKYDQNFKGSAKNFIDNLEFPETSNIDSIKSSVDKAKKIASDALNLYIIPGIVLALVFAFGTGLIFWNIIMKPIRDIEEKAKAVSGGDLSQKIEYKSKSELGTLATVFNEMVQNLNTMVANEKKTKEQLQKNVGDFTRVLQQAAEGDLTKRMKGAGSDEMAMLAEVYNQMMDNLQGLVRKVQELAFEVSNSIEQILGATERQAEGAETQSMQISDTSASLEELLVSIQQVSENALIAEEEAKQASQVAMRGGEIVEKTIEGMTNIRKTVQATAKKIKGLGESSQEIGEIVQVIGDIAEQTNLLALNAAIEAARAGESGKGFSVVAEEVKVLAERSSKATKEIGTLIKRTQSETNESVMAMEQGTKDVLEGTKMADEAGDALREIVKVVMRTADVIKEISMAAKQQASAAEGVVQSMENIAQVTKQSAGGSKKTASAANNLMKMAEQFKTVISTFKVE